MKIQYGTQLGDYRVIGFIGAGGMGTVYRAEHVRHGYPAALKLMNEADARYAARFHNEARLLASLRHPHIARFYDYFEAAGRACLAMELVEGPTVSELVRERGGPLDEREALRLLRDVTDALVYLHERGILHRDLKSSNLKRTPDGAVKVLDFGIARLDGTTRLTAAGQVIGTPQYLAPEQLRGEPPTPRTDFWAVGVMLYEWTTGHLPFDGGPTELYRRILAVDLLDPRTLNPELSEPVAAIIRRCLRPRPGGRPASARTLLETVEALLAAPDPPARRPPLDLHRLGRTLARPQALLTGVLGTAAVAAGLLVAGSLSDGGTPPPEPPAHEDASSLRVLPAERSRPPGRLRYDPYTQPAGAATVEVVIDVYGAPADVYRDGRPVGRTPYRLRAPTGHHVQLVLERPGYAPRRLQVQMPATATTFKETLEPTR